MSLSDDHPVILRCALTVSGELAQSTLPVPRWQWARADEKMRAHLYKSVRSGLAEMIVKDITPRVTVTGDGAAVVAESDPLLPAAIRQAKAHRAGLDLLYRQLRHEGHAYAMAQAREAAEAVDRLVTQLHQDVSHAARESPPAQDRTGSQSVNSTRSTGRSHPLSMREGSPRSAP